MRWRANAARRFGCIALLAQLDARRLYLGAGCSSLFAYCTQVLHLSEHAAYGRIEAARTANMFPIVLDLLRDGSLTLTAITLLAPHLTPVNHRDVLRDARHKSKREVEHLLARLRPQPAVPATVRKLPAQTPHDTHVASTGEQGVEHHGACVPSPRPAARPAVVAPLAPERYKVQFTMSRETHDKLRRVQDLLRHSIPDGDPAAIFDRALTLLLSDLERAKLAATAAAADVASADRRFTAHSSRGEAGGLDARRRTMRLRRDARPLPGARVPRVSSSGTVRDGWTGPGREHRAQVPRAQRI